MNAETTTPAWQSIAILVGRLIFAAAFLMAVASRSWVWATPPATSPRRASRLRCCWPGWRPSSNAILVICFLTGAYFSEAALLAAVYVVFLAFAFHGPSHWAGNQAEFGFFVDHFTFLAGLLFAAVHGPGRILALRRSVLG